MWAVSVTGVIFLKRVLTLSRQTGMYLSNSIIILDFSKSCVRVSIQLVTKLFGGRTMYMYKKRYKKEIKMSLTDSNLNLED